MSQIESNSNIESIISAISLINTSMSIPVDLPIEKKRVHFRQLTTAQEKRLVKDLLSHNGDGSTLIASILPILKENCENHEIDIDKLTIVDMYAIVLKMRIFSIGNELNLRIQKKKPKTGSFTTKVSLNNIYDQLIDNIKGLKSIGFVVNMPPYEIRCELPTVKSLVDSVNEPIDTDYDALFVETARMVRSIDLIANDKESKTIDLSSMKHEDKIKIMESMPNAILTKVYAETVKLVKSIRDLLLFDFTYEGEHYRQTIDLTSPDFFTVF